MSGSKESAGAGEDGDLSHGPAHPPLKLANQARVDHVTLWNSAHLSLGVRVFGAPHIFLHYIPPSRKDAIDS